MKKEALNFEDFRNLLEANFLRKKASEKFSPLLQEIRKKIPELIINLDKPLIGKLSIDNKRPEFNNKPTFGWSNIDRIEIRIELELGIDELYFKGEIEFRGTDCEVGGTPIEQIQFYDHQNAMKLRDSFKFFFQNQKDFDYLEKTFKELFSETQNLIIAMHQN